MESSSGTSEIVESKEDLDPIHYSIGLNPSSFKSGLDSKYGNSFSPMREHHSVEDDINKLIEAIDLRTLSRGVGSPRKNPQKRPMRDSISQTSGIGISESVTLKQALRGLCISNASGVAAMKRLSKPASVSGAEAGTIKRLYRAVVVEAGESGLPHSEEKGDFVEISIVSEKDAMVSSEKATKSSDMPIKESENASALSSPCADATKTKLMMTKTSSQDIVSPATSSVVCETSTSEHRIDENPNSKSSTSSSIAGSEDRISSASLQAIKPVCKKNFTTKKGRPDSALLSGSSNASLKDQMGALGTSVNNLCVQPDECSHKNAGKEYDTPASRSTRLNGASPKRVNSASNASARLTGASPKRVNSASNVASARLNGASPKSVNSASNVAISLSSCQGDKTVGAKTSESSRSKDKGECSQSSKSSIGEYSSSTSISEDSSSMSGSSFHGNRPHMSRDSRWEAIHHVEKQHGSLGLEHFKLLKRLGCGDIGTVYLAELTGTGCLFALKVMDNFFLASRKKLPRAQTEREILQMLDHPFLPTLYTHFTNNRLSCLVMEYCPGGDLHVLRQRQPGKSFSEQAARFYTAEVLLALEYLHMLGVVYRDLKPENILVREDGHIMLSDFDLSLRCVVNPTLLKSSAPIVEPTKRLSGPCADSSCIDPLCLQPSWVQMSCFTPRLISTATKTRKLKSDLASQVSPLPQLVAEPTSARSNSFVGTHEYLAPEIIKGEGHGSAVDWWTFGIFLYELLFGTTPFKGLRNEDTLANAVTHSLKFPESPSVSFNARDLIRGLLIKEPENRLGSVRGATEIKQHPFFEGLNWALIRCAIPPEMPKNGDTGSFGGPFQKKESKCLMFRTHGEDMEFELF